MLRKLLNALALLKTVSSLLDLALNSLFCPNKHRENLLCQGNKQALYTTISYMAAWYPQRLHESNHMRRWARSGLTQITFFFFLASFRLLHRGNNRFSPLSPCISFFQHHRMFLNLEWHHPLLYQQPLKAKSKEERERWISEAKHFEK